ncbi:tigger transposable element-derived protein 4-like [Culex pipiens pallens]|uniref:tigger transposable element-derived protein 4-like n=1 Tax=Culex pipiens pallens TaxID=42434 RepID=UPI0022AB1244|nr:tigger transposable element-derived protein 4-like [Culex pipiens pallens]
MSPRPDTRRKLTVLTVHERMKIIEKHAAGWKIGAISETYGVPQSTVSTVVKNKEKWIAMQDKGNLRKPRAVSNERLEKAMKLFVQQARENNLPLSGIMIREKAKDFACQLGFTEFKGSAGWLSKFAKRQNLAFKKLCGESASVDTNMCDDFKQKTLPDLVRGYDPKDIYNADETASFYKCLPDKTYTMQSEACHGGKYSKQRITVLCATNMDGSDKLPLLVIGKSKKPRCFKNVKSLPVIYESNSKAWMTSLIFEKWLNDLDRKFGEENRKVLMFVDNCTAHPKRLQDKLININLQFFPPNATSVLQPLDLGIIKNLKHYYPSSNYCCQALFATNSKQSKIAVATFTQHFWRQKKRTATKRLATIAR